MTTIYGQFSNLNFHPDDRARVLVRFKPEPRTEMRLDPDPQRRSRLVRFDVEKFPELHQTIAASMLPRHKKLSQLTQDRMRLEIDETGQITSVDFADDEPDETPDDEVVTVDDLAAQLDD